MTNAMPDPSSSSWCGKRAYQARTALEISMFGAGAFYFLDSPGNELCSRVARDVNAPAVPEALRGVNVAASLRIATKPQDRPADRPVACARQDANGLPKA
jgi:hypothetical protein